MKHKNTFSPAVSGPAGRHDHRRQNDLCLTAGGFISGRLAERTIASALKPDMGNTNGGSNPSPSAMGELPSFSPNTERHTRGGLPLSNRAGNSRCRTTNKPAAARPRGQTAALMSWGYRRQVGGVSLSPSASWRQQSENTGNGASAHTPVDVVKACGAVRRLCGQFYRQMNPRPSTKGMPRTVRLPASPRQGNCENRNQQCKSWGRDNSPPTA